MYSQERHEIIISLIQQFPDQPGIYDAVPESPPKRHKGCNSYSHFRTCNSLDVAMNKRTVKYSI